MKSCPVLKAKAPQRIAGEIHFELEAQTGPDPDDVEVVAEADVSLARKGSKKLAIVSFIKTHGYARCGVGTALYTQIRDFACKNNLTLASDTDRTDASNGFWQKQVDKGRASCIDKSEPGNRLDKDFNRVGFWPCRRFALKTTSCSGTLEGLRGLRGVPTKKRGKPVCVDRKGRVVPCTKPKKPRAR